MNRRVVLWTADGHLSIEIGMKQRISLLECTVKYNVTADVTEVLLS